MNSYDKLLDNVYSNLPEKSTKDERFEAPVFQSFTEGNKTIIKNFGFVAERLRREKSILMKYLSKELAVPVTLEGERLVLQRRLNTELLNKKLQEFINRYVICKECKKPDTHIEDVGHGLRQLVCEACGARNPVS